MFGSFPDLDNHHLCESLHESSLLARSSLLPGAGAQIQHLDSASWELPSGNASKGLALGLTEAGGSEIPMTILGREGKESGTERGLVSGWQEHQGWRLVTSGNARTPSYSCNSRIFAEVPAHRILPFPNQENPLQPKFSRVNERNGLVCNQEPCLVLAQFLSSERTLLNIVSLSFLVTLLESLDFRS